MEQSRSQHPDAGRETRHERRPKPVASAAPVDLTVLARYVGADPARIDAVAQLFLTSLRDGRQRLRAAAEAGDAAAVAALAHDLKCTARTVGALALGDWCETIEFEGRAGRQDALAKLLPHFEAESQAVQAALARRPRLG